ncbi:SpaA isopeptide-forming pilin-related protein [uncultured Gemmiger sp.]|uniref:SpaA isopeptide-forming pilin-related protein n=1 Tax=uncultured Gemmiger sp. TaxID=1623490 RepID=UPI0025F6E8AE|nr:SpaA isopeptide-forming pilin-related protein [uncultured Gemmiger sp.]
MSKHSTTPRTLSRRLAALLAALALLAAMALPVYAEALDSATGTAQAEIGDTISDGTVTTENDSTTPEKEAAKDSTANADGNNASENEDTKDNASPSTTGDSNTTADDAANDTPQTPPADNTAPTAGKTATNDTLDTMDEDEDAKQDIVTQSTDDAEESHITQMLAAQTSDSSFKIYFAVPTKFATNNYTGVKLNYQKSDNNWPGMKDMKLLQSRDYSGRKVYEITISPEECPEYFQVVQFHYMNANGNQVTGNGNFEELSGYQYRRDIANKLYDAETKTWEDFTPYDLNNHQTFAGKTMLFQNQSDHKLTDVKAIFYEKDQEVATIGLGPIAVGERVSFKIPEEDCSYIRFRIEESETTLYSFYGQQNDDTANSYFLYDSGTACCYVYKADDSSSWAIPEGKITVYFDATFSSAYTENGDTLSIPKRGSEDVYCCFKNEQTTPSAQKMTPCGNNLYSVEVPEGYSEIMFSGDDSRTSPANSGVSTDWVPIDWSLDEPCYMADTNDAVVYNNNAPRGGYWTEKKAVRDAETGKSTDGNQKDVVKVSQGTFVADRATKYISTTLYDYYTDYELNGNSRTDYGVYEGPSHRNWVTFREFDQAISDYYKSYDEKEANGNKILYPIYTGHFQPSQWTAPFRDIAEKLNLYGWQDTYKTFISANNSAGDEDNSAEGKYDFAFQGIVANTLSKQGDLLMNGGTKTDSGVTPAATTLVEPHFNERFLSGANSKNAKLGEVYHNVSFPFTKKQIFLDEPGVDYWWYDSSKTSLYLREDTSKKQLYLGNDKNSGKNNSGETANYVDGKSKNLDSSGRAYGEDSTDVKTQYGFFPFNESLGNQVGVASKYNYGYGAKLEIPFSITSDGKVESSTTDKNGKKERVPIRYYFSGDDDVWVFIDGKLVLDIGGAHGKVSGILDFSQTDNQKNTVTAYVSQVKCNKYVGLGYGPNEKKYGPNGENITPKTEITYTINPNENDENDESKKNKTPTAYYQKNPVEIDDLTTGTHTLTMYYMERGMWESNMAVAFNFPDNNELQVQKIVEDRNVNKLFKGCFDDQRLFNFTIRNQATHYGKTEAAGDAVTTINLLQPGKSTPVQNFTTTATHAEPDTGGKNRFTIVNNPPDNPNVTDDTPLLNWYTQFEDLTPSPGSNKEKRYGILALGDGQTIDITGMSYLSFDVYVDSDEGDAALSNMYLELRDSKGKQKGCLGQTFIGGKDLYGQVEMHNKHWITVKLSLGDVKAEKDFDEKHVKELRFGCNYPRSIYLRNIVFSSKAVPQTVTGFTTKQEDIADYGSAQEGKLMPAVNAQYTSDAEKGTMVVDKNGGFVLQNKETVTFKDQFRRGSYLSINEQVDKNLFDTQWTIYEDGKAVTSTKEGDGKKLTLDGDSISLKDKTGTAPDDGRIELKNAEGDAAQIAPNYNAYDGIKPSKKDENDNTIVFRSYANPDATDADGETQLKVVFVNTVKTGSLTIKKEQDGKGENLDGNTYTFRVRFTNVGGHALEDEAIVEPYEVTVGKPCVINNIPVGTRFTIEEVTPEDGSKLTKVSVTGGGSGTMVLNNQTVRGSIVAGDENKAVATFTNTKQETLDITGEKVWKNADNSLMTEHPATIYVQLQRRCVGETSELSWTPVTYLNETYTRVEQKYEGMKFSFLGLPAKDYDGGNQTPYEYRVVEGSVDNKGVFQAVDDEKTITIGEKVYSVTYKYTASKPDDSSNNNAKQTVTITNTQQDPKFTLDVTKKSAENDGENDKQKLLEGVEFTLEKLDENGQVDTSFETKTGITDGQGVLKLKNSGGSTSDKAFADLEAGTYRLTETKTAEGYNLLSAPIVITFTKEGQCQIGDDGPMQANDKEIFTGNAAEGYTLKLTVLNRKTPALPHTGADAPSLWLLIGLPLAVAGLLILVFRYNKKGGRTR